MQPQSPIPGPVPEDGFLLSLFQITQPADLLTSPIELDEQVDVPMPSPYAAHDDNQCACE